MLHTDSKRRWWVTALLVLVAATTSEARPTTLSNGRISVLLGDRGMSTITDINIGRTFKLKDDGFRITIDGRTFDSATLREPRREAGKDRAVFTFSHPDVLDHDTRLAAYEEQVCAK